MSMTYDTTKTLVRRKGSVDRVVEDYVSDRQYGSDTQRTGNRRSRQIAKRHWLREYNHGWCSGGGVWGRTTVKTPRKLRGVIRKQCAGGTDYRD